MNKNRKALQEYENTLHTIALASSGSSSSSSVASKMNFVTFNQDYSCLALGTRNGYRIYNCDPFGKCYEHKEGDIGIIEMLFSTSLIAIILSPRRLQITNTKVCMEKVNGGGRNLMKQAVR